MNGSHTISYPETVYKRIMSMKIAFVVVQKCQFLKNAGLATMYERAFIKLNPLGALKGPNCFIEI
jgi:hypothetical protein